MSDQLLHRYFRINLQRDKWDLKWGNGLNKGAYRGDDDFGALQRVQHLYAGGDSVILGA